MSFGYSISDGVLLCQLAWSTVQNSRKACGEHDELTREVSALHVVLQRLHQEVDKPDSPVNKSGDSCRAELETNVTHCEKVLRALDKILVKYNALGENEKRGRKLWQRVRFGNGEMADLGDLRSKIVLYSTTITFYLNMASLGAVGRIEEQMNTTGGILKEIQLAVNSITTQFMSKSNYEGSVFTTYADDDKGVWREFRRELVHDGFSSSTLHKHKRVIMEYVKELGSRGLLDDQDPDDICCDHEVETEADLSKDTTASYRSTPQIHLSSNGGTARHQEKQAEPEFESSECVTLEPIPKQSDTDSNIMINEAPLPDAETPVMSVPPSHDKQTKIFDIYQAYAETVVDSASDASRSDSVDGSSVARGPMSISEEESVGDESLGSERSLERIFEPAESKQAQAKFERDPGEEQIEEANGALKTGQKEQSCTNSKRRKSFWGKTKHLEERIHRSRAKLTTILATEAKFIADSGGRITDLDQFGNQASVFFLRSDCMTLRAECETLLEDMAEVHLKSKRSEGDQNTYDSLSSRRKTLVDRCIMSDHLEKPNLLKIMKKLRDYVNWALDRNSPFIRNPKDYKFRAI